MMTNKLLKTKEVLIEEAIHRQKAKDAKRKKLCMIDDCEILDEQIMPTDFKGTHPVGQDSATKSRREWLHDQQHPDIYKGAYRWLFIFSTAYLAAHITVALIKYLFKI